MRWTNFCWAGLALVLVGNEAKAATLSAAACASPGTGLLFDADNCASTFGSGFVSDTFGGVHPVDPATSIVSAATAQAKSYGELGIGGGISGTGRVGSGFFLYGHVHSVASASDVLYIGALNEGVLRFTWQIDGSATFNLPGGSGLLQLRANGVNYDLGFFGLLPPDPIVYDLPYSGGVAGISASLLGFLSCSPSWFTCEGRAVYELENTAKLMLIELYDLNGNKIENPGITSESGFAYNTTAPAGAVPEPATAALMVLGLASLLAIRLSPFQARISSRIMRKTPEV